MNPGFQEGRRPRANAVASLANTGHVGPLARRVGFGALAQAHQPGLAGRPGPQPLSARRTMAINGQNARIRQEVEQVAFECKRAIQQSNDQIRRRAASLAFASYDYDKRTDGRELTDATGSPIGIALFQAGSLWIYATSLRDGWGDHKYAVYNPDTGAVLVFEPESAISNPKQHLYASRRAQIQGTAAVTGAVGGHLEKLFIGTTATFLTGGAAAEMGAYAYVAEEVAPFVARTAVSAYRIGAPMARAAYIRSKTGFALRAGTDLGIQLFSGFATGKGSILERSKQAAINVNGTSVLMAGVVNTQNVPLSKLAKWLVAGSTAAASNAVTVSAANIDQHGNVGHILDLSNGQEASRFAFSVILGAILDRGRDVITEHGAERLLEAAAHARGRVQRAALRWVEAKRVTIGLNCSLGFTFESGKKSLEYLWDKHNERVKEEENTKFAQNKVLEHLQKRKIN